MIAHSTAHGRRSTHLLVSWASALSALALILGCSDSDTLLTHGATAGAGGSSAGASAEGGSLASAGALGNHAGSGGEAAGGSAGTSENTAGDEGMGDAGASAGGSAGGAGGSSAGGGGVAGSNAGSGGTAGSSAGNSALAGAGGSLAGGGGASAAGATSGNAGGGVGGSGAGSGGSSGSAPVDPDGAIVTGNQLTAQIMGTTGDPATLFGVWDTCPDDQVLVGFNYVGFDDFISGLQAVCGKLTVKKTSQLEVSVAAGSTLSARGGEEPKTNGTTMCPANNVVVGFDGKVDDRIRRLSFTCAPVILVFEDGAPTIGVDLDHQSQLAAVGPVDQGGDFALTGCPDGQMARGTLMNESEFRNPNGWLEALTLTCGTPSFTFPNGAACASGSDCDSRACDTTCKAFTCNAPAGCTCQPFAGKSYAFCPAAATTDNAGSALICASTGMHLASVTDSATAGWLRNTSNAAGVSDDAYIGLDDRAVHGTWGVAPNGTPATFSNWGGGDYGLEPNCLDGIDCNGEVENCVTIRADGAWNNVNCTGTHAFMCSN